MEQQESDLLEQPQELAGLEPAGHGGLILKLGAALLAWTLIYRQLKPLAEWLTGDLFSLDLASRLGSSVAFFLYDTPKVLMLLVLIVFCVSVINTFFTPERTRQLLAGRNELVGNILAALLGIVTPFCSCSAVPLFIGFVQAGVPLGVTLSFLISAPMINEIALVLLLGLFGWRVAAIYVLSGLAVAMLAGYIIGRLKLERHVEDWVYAMQAGEAGDEERLSWAARIQSAGQSVKEIVGKVWPYLLAGIAVGAGIHGYVPEGVLVSFMGKDAWWSVPLAVVMGVPMYSNAAGMIPIVQALLEKGAALGTVLAFMMAVIGLSLPEMIILRKVLKPRLIGVFLGVVAVGIIATGYLFNFIM
ncbi:MAG: putative permease [Deltaproteobacteria bacterium ADurb.Bin510]|nr:MAG: putative permease [Deltaproteobacteria bacterium ADurb.Bin510]